MTRILAALAVSTAAFAFTPASVQAAGSDTYSDKAKSCKKGKTWDKKTKKCVDAKKSSGLSDDQLFENGQALAYAGRYEEALTVLELAENKHDARILNFRGYATRKMGDLEGGLVHYRAALAIDPDYVLAREYMGEALVTAGRMDEARDQLSEIATRCGTGCREYTMLEKAIADAG
ncbi:tetratricopeptide repeat protein [Rhizobiaceae bacterium]|nr:tetratricopeptide repeat protein [Rhizobiaceae bacterium]